MAYQIRSAVKLDIERYYSGGQNSIWTPGDFGQARMAAEAWLYAASLKESDPKAGFAARRAIVEKSKVDPRALWDWYYLQLVLADPKQSYAASVRLARALPTDPSAQYAFLTDLGSRVTDPNPSRRYVAPGSVSKVDKTPPLPADELKLVLDGFESLRKRRPELIQIQILSNFDYGAILLLRNAFEIYKKADLASDLIAHFRSQVAKAPDDAKLFPTLALSYLLWWNDDKDDALREYTRATELAKNDGDLRLSLADLRAQRGEPVEPLDQRTMQRREMLALRLSVLAGDVQRARQASERLFGLRLDGETQIQLANSPSSLQLLQTLVDYYRADGQRDKVTSTYDRIAKLRPDDAKLRFQIANQLSQSGAAAESLDHYRAALKKEPALFANQYYEVQSAFRHANKPDELVKLYDSMDFKSFSSNPWIIQNTLQQLFQDTKTRDHALILFRKAWKEMPESRTQLLGNLHNDDVWNLPEIYDYARQVVIPAAGKMVTNPWDGLDQINSWGGGDGRVNGVFSRLVEAAACQNKLDGLAAEVAQALNRSPEWTGGKALIGVIKARRGKVDEARADLEAVLNGDTTIPSASRMFIGQELDKITALKDLEIKFYEGAMAEDTDGMMRNNGFQYGPGKRLAQLYKKSGRSKDARDLILKYARTPNDWNGYDPNYASYQKINEFMQLASLMVEIGYPADAALFYSEIANDTDAINNARQWYGNTDQLSNQIRQGLTQSLQGMGKETMERTVRTLLTPKPDAKPGEPRLDLVLLCHPRDLDKAGVICLFAEAVKSLKDSKEFDAEVHATMAKLVADHPNDLSVQAAAAMLAAADNRPETLAPAAERLAKLVEATPLDLLPANVRPNARQRDEAARQLLVWVVARDCAKHNVTRPIGDRLAARAIEAARRSMFKLVRRQDAEADSPSRRPVDQGCPGATRVAGRALPHGGRHSRTVRPGRWAGQARGRARNAGALD